MRILHSFEFKQGRTSSDVDAILAATVTHTGLDLMGGLLLANCEWHSACDDEVQFGIDLKLLARDRGMYFLQPISKLNDAELMHEIRNEHRKRGWEGPFLFIPEGWRFVDQVDDLDAIEEFLDAELRDRVYLPTTDSGIQDAPDQFTELPECPTSGVYFGRLERLEAQRYAFLLAIGGVVKPIVERVP